MIRRVEARWFRSLLCVDQTLEPFQVLVGPNGSGKSNFLDAIGFLGDLVKVGPLRAILGDARADVAPRAADPAHLCFMRQGSRFELAIELDIPPDLAENLRDRKYGRVRHEVAIETVGDAAGGEVRLEAETLWLGPKRGAGAPRQRTLFPNVVVPIVSRPSIVQEPDRKAPEWKRVVHKIGASGNDHFYSETSGWNAPFRLGPTKSALGNLPEDESRFPVATWVKGILLEGVERVALNAASLRAPSPPGSPRRFRPDGSNLPWVVENLQVTNPATFGRWLEHVRTAIPDLRTVRTVERAEDRSRYLVLEHENGLNAPSWLVSDGTLRLLALTLLGYLPETRGIYLIEEPENGIHPRAVETVYQALSTVLDAQVLCASHSPVLLAMARPEHLLCFAKDATGATDIVSGTEHPFLREWRGSLDLGTLFASGVLG